MTDEIDATSLAARVSRLEALEEIRRLVHDYSFKVDDHDFDGIAACFETEGRYRTVDDLIDVRGRASIHGYFRDRMANLGPTCHVTHDHVVDLDAGDPTRAVGRVTSHAEVVLDGVPMCVCLRYDDRYVVEEGRWRFAERVMRFFYYCPIDEYPEILTTRRRTVIAGAGRDADIPEGIPGWTGQMPRED